MRDVLIITRQFPPATGGVSESLEGFCRHWDPQRVAVLTSGLPGSHALDATMPFPVYRYDPRIDLAFESRSVRRFGGALAALATLGLRIAWRTRPRAVLCYTARAVDLFPAYLLRLEQGIPYAAYCHGDDLPVPGRLLKRDRLRLPLLDRAARIFTNSAATAGRVAALGVGRSRTCVVSPGIDTDRYCPGDGGRLRRSLGIAPSEAVVLTVGRLDLRKGHDMVIRALAALRREQPNVRYVIVGDGQERTRLMSLARDLGVQDAVLFVGYQPAGLLPDYYRLCDVFAMPNRELPDGDTEGLGLVFLEASACRKPVIGGRAGGAVNAVAHGRTGYLVEPNGPDDVTARLKELLADPALRREMGAAGRCHAVANYSIVNQARKLWGELQSLSHRQGRWRRPGSRVRTEGTSK